VIGTLLLVKYRNCYSANPGSLVVYELAEAVVIVIHILVDCPLLLMIIEWLRSFNDRDKDIGEVREQ